MSNYSINLNLERINDRLGALLGIMVAVHPEAARASADAKIAEAARVKAEKAKYREQLDWAAAHGRTITGYPAYGVKIRGKTHTGLSHVEMMMMFEYSNGVDPGDIIIYAGPAYDSLLLKLASDAKVDSASRAAASAIDECVAKYGYIPEGESPPPELEKYATGHSG